MNPEMTDLAKDWNSFHEIPQQVRDDSSAGELQLKEIF